MRRLVRILVILGIVLAVVFFGARWYLSSAHVAHQVAEQLSTLYGAPVHVEHADIGFTGSSLGGVSFAEANASADQNPWLTLGSVHADVSLWDLLSGKSMPHYVAVHSGQVYLRFDKNGKLLTRLPSGSTTTGHGQGTTVFPTISVEDCQLTLGKEGQIPIHVNGFSLTVHPEGSKIRITGEGHSPRWGKLVLSGDVNTKDYAANVHLKTVDSIHVTQAMLDSLPYIPPSVWQDVQAEGDTPAKLTVRYDPKPNKIHYRVELEPKNTKVRVPAAGLKGSNASGKIIVDDYVVKLRNIRGQAYNGTLAGDADYDFTKKVAEIRFKPLEAHNLDIRQLPQSWGLPKELEGRLDASGNFTVVLNHGHVTTSGEAKAEIRNARLAGQPVEGPIDLELAPEGPPLQVGGVGAAGGEQAQQPKVPPPPQRRRPTYLTVKLNLKDAKLDQMVEKLNLKLPFPIKGRLNFHGKVAIPMSGKKEAKDYRFTGSALITKAAIGDVHLEKIEADAVYRNGLLQLDKLYGVAPGAAPPVPGQPTPGTFQGNLRAQVDPPGEATAQLDVTQLPIGQAAKELGIKEEVKGEITGSISAKVSLARLQKDKQWDGSGQLHLKRVSAFGWTLQDLVADVLLKGQDLILEDLHGQLEGTTITGAGKMKLEAPYRYQATLEVRDADLAAIERLAKDMRPTVNLAGRATLTANLRGTMQPFDMNSTGTAALTGLHVDQLKFRKVNLAWENTADQLKVKDLKAKLYGGQVTGSAAIPLKAEAAGSVDLALKDIDVGQLLKEAKIGLPIEGQAGGTVKGTVAPAPKGKQRPIDLTLSLKAPKLKVEGLEAEELKGTVRYHGEDIAYDFEAKTLGGTLQVEGKVPRNAAEPGEQVGSGKLQAHGLHLEKLAPAFGARHGTFPLSGRLDANMTYHFEGPHRAPVGTGRVALTNLAWDDTEWLGRTQAEIELDGERLLVRDLHATLAQGSVTGRLSYSWKNPRLNWYQLAMYNVQAEDLLVAWPALQKRIQGPLSAVVRGKFGRELTGHGTVVLQRGKVAGLDVVEGRLPFQAVYVPKQHRGRLRVTAGSATVALGQVSGDATYGFGETQDLRGNLNFRNVDASHLLRSAAESAHLGGGKLTGKMSFSGPGLTSLDRMTASVDTAFSQAQALQWPVLSALAPFLRMGRSPSFQSGQLRGTLGNGVFRIQRLSLQGGPANIYATGTATTAGRLGLDVRAGLPNMGSRSPALRMLATRLPLVGSIPGATLARATSVLSSQLIYARVTGTVRSPTVQILPLRTLQEDAVRFFVGSSTR